MSLYSDLKSVMLIVETCQALEEKVAAIEREASAMRERLAYLEGRETAIVLTAKAAVEEALRDASIQRPGLVAQKKNRADG